jgi:hypothetical protein
MATVFFAVQFNEKFIDYAHAEHNIRHCEVNTRIN